MDHNHKWVKREFGAIVKTLTDTQNSVKRNYHYLHEVFDRTWATLAHLKTQTELEEMDFERDFDLNTVIGEDETDQKGTLPITHCPKICNVYCCTEVVSTSWSCSECHTCLVSSVLGAHHMAPLTVRVTNYSQISRNMEIVMLLFDYCDLNRCSTGA